MSGTSVLATPDEPAKIPDAVVSRHRAGLSAEPSALPATRLSAIVAPTAGIAAITALTSSTTKLSAGDTELGSHTEWREPSPWRCLRPTWERVESWAGRLQG